ncbi:STAS domain-containing protein [Rhodococcus fascians]|nr:STAS domain-containing protein [Rhodococcus fascians]MBY3995118.1 STAS domain-containing protein [Rhodococcus fascians]MBY4000562.1 STAS domain-containing protein [Rhodococcus fascians]MBY4005590.1 STAS domain-containing protein [Rhodococcus fascians]MBY4016423.1 STAS domain-containing protein [Rhodococcus fascians]
MKYNELLGLGISSEQHDDSIVLRVNGEVDLATASDLAHHIEAAVAAAPTAVIVDMSGVSFLASVGMSVLIAARRKACCSTSLVVVASGPSTGRPMHLVGLDAAVPIFTDVRSALESVGSTVEDLTVDASAPYEISPGCPECTTGTSTDDIRTA